MSIYTTGGHEDGKSAASSFNFDADMTCKQLKDKFKKDFGAVLRVKNGNRRVPDDIILSTTGAQNVAIEYDDTLTVGDFQKTFKEKTGLTVVVATADDWVAVIPEIPLCLAGKVPNNTTVEKMKQFLIEHKA